MKFDLLVSLPYIFPLPLFKMPYSLSLGRHFAPHSVYETRPDTQVFSAFTSSKYDRKNIQSSAKLKL
jgi:hypothetical protein